MKSVWRKEDCKLLKKLNCFHLLLDQHQVYMKIINTIHDHSNLIKISYSQILTISFPNKRLEIPINNIEILK